MKNHSNIFLYSDPHYGHKNILTYCSNRKFKTVEEMNATLINNWNRVVQPEDTVIVLGDMFFHCKDGIRREIMEQLDGKKVLIVGNHDDSCRKMMNLGFAWACDGMYLNIQGTKVLLSHYPYKPSIWIRLKNLLLSRKIRHMDKFPIDRGEFLLHGHTHSTKKVRGRQIHVGVDSWNMTPVSVDKIASIINQIKNNGRWDGN